MPLDQKPFTSSACFAGGSGSSQNGCRESPSRWSAWRAGSPAPTTLHHSGGCWQQGRTRSPRVFRVPASGAWANCSRTPFRTRHAVSPPSSTTWTSSTPRSSAFRRSRRNCWTHSNGSCWRRVGRRSKTAGIDPDALRGSRTGVYGGISNNDYRGLILEASDPAEPAASLYAVSGSSYNTAIGRVAFALGLQGPAIAIDTACSSSLVAIHQAMAGLQRGEADLALAGGVHTILSGRLMALRANAGMLAPDGRCKTFDAAADGYVRGEGCGMLVLKRLREAEADGDRIWGVIRGSALNQDGASTGLTVPSEEAQEQVIVDALRRSGVLPLAGGLRGGARHRNAGGRPDRVAGGGGGVRPQPLGCAPVADRLRENEFSATWSRPPALPR